MSAEIGELAAALARAQGMMTPAKKDSNNPFFNSKYADLAAVWAACREPLSSNGLAVVQQVLTRQTGAMYLRSMLIHSSGQWMASEYPIRLLPPLSKDGKPMPVTPQVVGSEIAYVRRYSQSALVGVSADDDDGNSASRHEGEQQERRPRLRSASRPRLRSASRPRKPPRPLPNSPPSLKSASSIGLAALKKPSRAPIGSSLMP
jgi:hypothetical protein